MALFDDHAGIFLADFGSSTRWTPSAGGAAVTGLMLLDRPDEVLDGEAISRQYQVQFTTAAWPGLKRGEVLVIDGASYRLRTDPRQLDDGLFATALLTKE